MKERFETTLNTIEKEELSENDQLSIDHLWSEEVKKL